MVSKKWIALFICLLMAFLMSACSGVPDTETLLVSDYLAEQADVDAALLAECSAGHAFDAPLILLNPYGNAPLSAVAVFTTDEAIGGTVTVKGRAAEDDITSRFEAAIEHCAPVIGLYAGCVNHVEIALDDGRISAMEVETEPLELGLSGYSAKMADASLYDYDTLTVCANMILHCFAAYDSHGDLRWVLTNTGANAITRLDNGHFLIPNIYGHGAEFPNGLTGIREIDPLGKVYNVYVWNGGEHHEILALPKGNYLMTGSRPGYATNRDFLFEIDPATGEVVWELDMAEVITPGSSGCESDKGEDWCHSNALAYDETSDTLLISCRHLCAVVAVNKTEKTLKWIFGDPAGWADAYTPYLLKAGSDDFPWAYGQHQITILGNGDLLLFDNGEFGRVKAVNADRAIPDERNYSRAVIYRVDADKQTVEQIWEYGRELGAVCYSSSMSGVQVLDEASGRFLVTFGTCVNAEGETAVHIKYIEDNACFWSMDYAGSSAYRSYRYNLCQEGMYNPRVRGLWHGDMGVTAQVSGVELQLDEAAAAPDGVKVELFPFSALRFSGSFDVEDESLLTDYTVALVASNGTTRRYDLGYTKSKTDDGFKVSLSRWVSLKDLPADTYDIYMVMGGKTFAMGVVSPL